MTEQQLREKYVSTAKSFVGAVKGDAKHKQIIDTYNNHTPLPIGYKVKYTDHWCATTVSSIAIMCGLEDIIPQECSCSRQIALLKKINSWEEKDSYVPKIGDLIYYDWDDGADYARTDNRGAPEHVGIIVESNGKTIKVLEGNMTWKGKSVVGYRNIYVNGRYIRGFGVPNYAKKATPEPVKAPVKNTVGAKYSTSNGIHVVEVPASVFKLKMLNDTKRGVSEKGYANANFFGAYRENGYSFTLPVGHIVCDYDLDKKTSNQCHELCDKYCRERGKVVNGKFTYDNSTWKYSNPFYGNPLTTLMIKNGVASIRDIISIGEWKCDYAVTGIPVMQNGNDVSWLNYVKGQGWTGSELKASWHTFVGLKANKTVVYVMSMKTTSSNLIYSAEAYKKFKALEFVDVICLDGGGSAQLTVDGKSKVSTLENRRINAIITFGETVKTSNPYPVPTVAVTQKTTDKNAVKWLQWELNRHGASLEVDGSFGPATLAALKTYQKSVGLAADGSCGPATRAALLK